MLKGSTVKEVNVFRRQMRSQ